jgi:parvulin-like peptidyl-prolyl isomerase
MRKITPNLINPKYREFVEKFKGGKLIVSAALKTGWEIFKIEKISNVF